MTDTKQEVGPTVAAILLAVNPRTITRWADDGTLRVCRWTEGGQRRFLLKDVQRLAKQRNGGTA